MTQEIDSAEADIAAFTRAERLRKAKVFGIGGVVCMLLGIVAVIVGVTAGDPAGSSRYEIKALAAGIALVLTGGSFLVSAWRVGTGQVADVEYEVPR
jgi:hypothetical protein